MNRYQEALNKIKTEFWNYYGWEHCTEETNLLQELVDKATPKKPIIQGLGQVTMHYCPNCKKELILTNNEIVIYKTKTNYCDECAQALDWSDK